MMQEGHDAGIVEIFFANVIADLHSKMTRRIHRLSSLHAASISCRGTWHRDFSRPFHSRRVPTPHR